MSERLWGILVDSFGKILLPGLTVTIPLTAISFTLALIIAVAVALVQFAHVPVLQRLARFYIWVIRGTPVLVQLFVESANIEFLAKSVVIQCSAPPNFYIYIIPHISLIVNSFQKS